MEDRDDVDDLTLAEVQRERLRSARSREHSLGAIASASRWTTIILAAHAGVGVLQAPPSVPAVVLSVLSAGLAVLAWRPRR